MSGTARITPRTSPPPIGVGQGLGTQGMISPATAFVQPDLSLSTASFRFLFSILQAINQLQTDVATLQQRLTNAGIP